MCATPKIPAVQTPAQAVPLPLETSEAARVTTAADDLKKIKRNGRAGLTVPSASAATTSGMSGLNIPQ